MVKKLLTQIKHKTLTGEEVVMDIGAKASNVLPENFVEQKERSNLAAKDKLPVIFGKLSKWYADLRPVAWSGSYSDLTNKPTIPEGSAANYQVANNDTTEAEGFVADARIVRIHGLEIDGLSRDKMDKYYGTATLSDVSETTVLKHLILDADLIHQSHEISFSVIVNSLHFYSGIMYSDGGQTAWGQIQQRNLDNAPGSLYSFYYNRGADPVLKKLGSGFSLSNYVFNINVSTSGNGSSSGSQGRSGKSEFILDTKDYETLIIGSYKIEGDGAHAAWDPRNCVSLSVVINGAKTVVNEGGHTFDVKNTDSATIVATFGTNGNPDYGTWATLTVSKITMV